MFMIDWLPAGDKAVHISAFKSGLFAAEGLDVTIQSGPRLFRCRDQTWHRLGGYGHGRPCSTPSGAGESKVPVKAVMSLYTLQPDAIFTTEGSGISASRMSAGKTVATATSHRRTSLGRWSCGRMASIRQGRLLKVDPARACADAGLGTGRSRPSIGSTVAPAFEKPLAEGGKKIKIIQWSDYGFDGYGFSVFASEKMLAANARRR